MEERQIGQNIRELRTSAGLTVTALAASSGLTKSTVSKIETGSISPPISTLVRIASALDVTLARLFTEPETEPNYVLTRAGEGRIITRDGTKFGYSYEGLALSMRHKQIEPFLLTIKPGDPAGRFQHGGQEFIFMLEGKMEFTVGNEKLILNPGDSLYFDPTPPHTTRVAGRKAVRFLTVFVTDANRPSTKISRRTKEKNG
jgi:transcriptional regulator with XRE-family HTH domain